MTDYVDLMRHEAVQEMASAILKAAGEVMTRYGNDPHGNVIVAAGFAMAIKGIGDKIDPRVPMTIAELLK